MNQSNLTPMELSRAVKHQMAERVLESSVLYVMLNATAEGVVVPPDMVAERLVLKFSYRFKPPDLSVDENRLRETLSFSGKLHYVEVPWDSVYAMRAEHEEGFWTTFPMSMPDDIAKEMLKPTPTVPRLRLVKN